MKTGKITAKLRDAIPVCLMVEGKEVKGYKNIDLPDMLKEVEMLDFHFNVPEDGKITFEVSYAQVVLPEVFPEPRAKMTRAEKATAKAAAKTAAEQEAAAEENAPEASQEVTALVEVKPFDIAALIAPPTTGDTAPEAEPEAEEITEQAAEESRDEEAGSMEIHYNVTGPRRKELATAVGNFIGMAPVYMKAPTYGFAVSNYIIDRNGTLTGDSNKALVETLAEQGFSAA